MVMTEIGREKNKKAKKEMNLKFEIKALLPSPPP